MQRKEKKNTGDEKRCDIDMEAMARITGEISRFYQCRTKIVRKIGYEFLKSAIFLLKRRYPFRHK